MALGNTMVHTMQETAGKETGGKTKTEELRELKSLLDEGILTQEEFDAEKKRILSK